jgi:LEA14-like dessication related protein
MKNILPVAALVGAGLVFYRYLTGKKKAMENLQFEIFKISIDKQKTERALYFKIYYDIIITVINDELSPVKIKDTLMNIKVNNRDLGKVESTLNLLIPRESEKQITLKASFFTLGAIGLVKDIVKNGLQAQVNLNGYINTDLGKVDINFNKQFGGEINGEPKKKNYC